MEVLSASRVAALIPNESCIVPGGFGCCGHPDLFTDALASRFKQTGEPHSLDLLFASGAGDKQGKGLDRLAAMGMIREAIGGFWGFCPELTRLALEGKLEGHNWPMGVVSHLFREIAGGAPGLLSKVGLGTFVDPDIEGGVLKAGTPKLVTKTEFQNEEYLFYPSQKIDFALLRGTRSDPHGNISMEGEVAFHDALIQAMAARRCGGKVAVQVLEVVDSLPADQVKIPSILVDYVVICEEESEHPSSYGLQGETSPDNGKVDQEDIPLFKDIIIDRAVKELPKHKCCINLGIGLPALIGYRYGEKFSKQVLSVESGIFGGSPLYDLSFGASANPKAIIDQADLFTFYDSGGIDVAFLGFAEIDGMGRVNASRFGKRNTGAGGFINIAQAAKKIILCGSFTTGKLDVVKEQGQLKIKQEGAISKFVSQVQQITIDLQHPLYKDKEILIITERAVFKMTSNGLTLVEIAEGLNISDLRACMGFELEVSSDLEFMEI